MTVGEKIKFYREARKMTVAQLSEKAELAIDNIRKYESGARNPKLDALSKIANALGVNLNTLLDIDLKTPSDCAPYLLQMGNSLGIKFVGKKKDGYHTEDIAIQFESDFMQQFLCRWAEYIETINDLREKAKDTLDKDTRDFMLARADQMEKDMYVVLVDSIPFKNTPDGKQHHKMSSISQSSDNGM